jgi:hypothetical protein
MESKNCEGNAMGRAAMKRLVLSTCLMICFVPAMTWGESEPQPRPMIEKEEVETCIKEAMNAKLHQDLVVEMKKRGAPAEEIKQVEASIRFCDSTYKIYQVNVQFIKLKIQQGKEEYKNRSSHPPTPAEKEKAKAAAQALGHPLSETEINMALTEMAELAHRNIGEAMLALDADDQWIHQTATEMIQYDVSSGAMTHFTAEKITEALRIHTQEAAYNWLHQQYDALIKEYEELRGRYLKLAGSSTIYAPPAHHTLNCMTYSIGSMVFTNCY